MSCEPVNDFLCPRLLQTFYFELHNNVIAKRSTLLLSLPRGETALQMLLRRDGRDQDPLKQRAESYNPLRWRSKTSYICCSCHKWAATMSCFYTWSIHHPLVESIFFARFDKINDLFPLQMSRSQSCCFSFVYLKHISLRVSGISMLSFSTEKYM